MNTKNKIMTLLALSAGGAAATALFNKYIKITAVSKNPVSYTHLDVYKRQLPYRTAFNSRSAKA